MYEVRSAKMIIAGRKMGPPTPSYMWGQPSCSPQSFIWWARWFHGGLNCFYNGVHFLNFVHIEERTEVNHSKERERRVGFPTSHPIKNKAKQKKKKNMETPKEWKEFSSTSMEKFKSAFGSLLTFLPEEMGGVSKLFR